MTAPQRATAADRMALEERVRVRRRSLSSSSSNPDSLATTARLQAMRRPSHDTPYFPSCWHELDSTARRTYLKQTYAFSLDPRKYARRDFPGALRASSRPTSLSPSYSHLRSHFLSLPLLKNLPSAGDYLRPLITLAALDKRTAGDVVAVLEDHISALLYFASKLIGKRDTLQGEMRRRSRDAEYMRERWYLDFKRRAQVQKEANELSERARVLRDVVAGMGVNHVHSRRN